MSGRFRVRPAREDDDAQLVALARTCPMNGPVSLAMERAPRFFTLCELQGNRSYVAVAEDGEGRIVDCASLAARWVYIDGVPAECFYAGDLRIAPAARGTGLLRQLHQQLSTDTSGAAADLAYASIMAGNGAAEALSRPRPGMPVYRRLGTIAVCVVAGGTGPAEGNGVDVRPAAPDDQADIVALLDEGNARHNFAPAWTPSTFERLLRSAPGLSIDRFLVALDGGGRLLGTLAAWDQRAFQQIRLLTAVAESAGETFTAAVPQPGQLVRHLSLTLVAVGADHPDVFGRLLASAACQAGPRSPLTFGLAEGHPLLHALAGFRARRFPTALYAISRPGSRWSDYDFGRRPLFHEISHLY